MCFLRKRRSTCQLVVSSMVSTETGMRAHMNATLQGTRKPGPFGITTGGGRYARKKRSEEGAEMRLEREHGQAVPSQMPVIA